MSPIAKMFLGLLTFWPIVYIVGLLAAFPLFISVFRSAAQTSNHMPTWFMGLFVIHGITALVVMALLVFYLIHLFGQAGLPTEMKVLWTILLLFFNMVAMPFYWYKYVWRGGW